MPERRERWKDKYAPWLATGLVVVGVAILYFLSDDGPDRSVDRIGEIIPQGTPALVLPEIPTAFATHPVGTEPGCDWYQIRVPYDVRKYAGIYYPVGLLGETYSMSPAVGLANVMGQVYEGRPTSMGETVPFRHNELYMATWKYPLGTRGDAHEVDQNGVYTGRFVKDVWVVSRGPNMLLAGQEGVLYDVSQEIARRLSPDPNNPKGQFRVEFSPIPPTGPNHPVYDFAGCG